MSRFGSRRSDEDVTEWPELKERPKAEDVTVLIAELAAKVDTLKAELSDKVDALTVELRTKDVIK